MISEDGPNTERARNVSISNTHIQRHTNTYRKWVTFSPVSPIMQEPNAEKAKRVSIGISTHTTHTHIHTHMKNGSHSRLYPQYIGT